MAGKGIFGVGLIKYRLLHASNIRQDHKDRFIAVHFETTGLEPDKERIVEIAAVLFEKGELVDTFCTLVNPGIRISDEVSKINGITNEMLANAPKEKQVMADFRDFLGDALRNKTMIVAYNANFMMQFLHKTLERHGYDATIQCADVLSLSRYMISGLVNYRMNTVASHLSLYVDSERRAQHGAILAGYIFLELMKQREGEDYSWEHFYDVYLTKQLPEIRALFFKIRKWGPSNEIFEVLDRYLFKDLVLVEDMMKALIKDKYRFDPEDILRMYNFPSELVGELVPYVSRPFEAEELVWLKEVLGDATFKKIKTKIKIAIPEYREKVEYTYKQPEVQIKEVYIPPEPPRKPKGMFGAILLGTVLGLLSGGSSKKHPGRCTGDCASCPPHFGYRYGRWYYGHDHVHGCEFGGNRGSGRMD